MQDRKIIIFDGICILCNRFVQFTLKKDRSKQFYFTTAQSDFTKEQLKDLHISVSPMDSVLYVKNNRVLTESAAVLGILSDLGGWWKLMSIFKVIPPFIRNAIYRFCAKRRYRVFGMRDACMIPDPEWKDRFL
ncbi:MAG: thiol-disulfide oxidoreductase DCC family protein [Crocinitomicaceae bacterium]